MVIPPGYSDAPWSLLGLRVVDKWREVHGDQTQSTAVQVPEGSKAGEARMNRGRQLNLIEYNVIKSFRCAAVQHRATEQKFP